MFDVICRYPALWKRAVARGLVVVLTMALYLSASFSFADDPGQTTAANGNAAPDVETSPLSFDELVPFQKSQPVQYRQFSVDTYRSKHGLLMGTCDLVGTPVVGKTIRLTNPMASFGIISGGDQPFISPHSLLIAAGGRTHDLLLTFEAPVTSVTIVSDKYAETPDVIRLLIVEPIEADKRQTVLEKHANRQVEVRVLAMDEKRDDAKSAPDNTLSVDLKGKPFHHVIIECTTEQEAFDDLRFTRAKSPPTDDKDRASPLFDWAWFARSGRAIQLNRDDMIWKGIKKGTGR